MNELLPGNRQLLARRPVRLGRRAFWGAGAGLLAGGVTLPAYALGIEPAWRLDITQYAPRIRAWPADLKLSIAVIADLHVGEPYMGLDRLGEIVDAANAMRPDITLILGDYDAGHKFVSRPVSPGETAAALARLQAPLGRFAILGNHDYWSGVERWRTSFAQAGVPVLENGVVRLQHGGHGFWLAGTASTLAYRIGRHRFHGLDDLPGTLRRVTDDAPVILMAHEPDIFARVPPRVALTLSGHTHGGQVRLLGWSPMVPSRFGNRYAYGHVMEEGRHLIVSGGLGISKLPVRFGVPPEIVMVHLGRHARPEIA